MTRTTEIDVPALTVAAVGGLAVACSYVLAFRGETEGFFESRFWLRMPPATTRALTFYLQIPAAIGYVVFLVYAAGIAGRCRPRTGVLSYCGGAGLTLTVALFSAASMLWAPLTRMHLDGKCGRAWPALALVAAALAVILMTAGAFEADIDWKGVAGVLSLATVVVVVDGVGWNAKLLHT